jgi:hypothetical protein
LADPQGNIVSKGKWSNDKNEDFDAIYQRLLALVPKPEAETPIYSGRFDYAWRPESSRALGMPAGYKK